MARNNLQSRRGELFGRAIKLGWLLLAFAVFLPFEDALADSSRTCGLRDQTIECHFNAPDTDNRALFLTNKITSAMESLKKAMPACSITGFDSSGEATSDIPQMIAFAEISQNSKCSVNEDQKLGKYRIAIESYAHTSLDCSRSLFKYSARGFDIYSNGTKSHWDTLTERLPWSSISDDAANLRLQTLFSALCR